MKKIVFYLLFTLNLSLFSQKSRLYSPGEVIVSGPISLFKNVYSSSSYSSSSGSYERGVELTYWYFSKNNGSMIRIDGNGTELKGAMEGCDKCLGILDSLNYYRKRGNRNTLGGLGLFVSSGAVVFTGIRMLSRNPNINDDGSEWAKKTILKRNIGTFLTAGGVVPFCFSIGFMIKGTRCHKIYWPGVLKRSIIEYNKYASD